MTDDDEDMFKGYGTFLERLLLEKIATTNLYNPNNHYENP